MFRDDAQGGDVTTEVNMVNDPAILTNPVLRSFTITNFEPSTDFMIYRVSVRAHNREGYFDSPYLRIMNAGHPLTLDTGITLLDKNQTSLHVEVPLVTEDDTTLSYELQIDNGKGGAFTSLGGFEYDSKEREYIVGDLNAGSTYRLRYRVRNFVGWSDYSETLFVLCATVPDAPDSVYLIAATDSSIYLGFHESLFNGGSEITAYELWMDDGFGSEFVQVTGYIDDSASHTISSGLVSGRIYTFKYRSQNSVGYSDFSVEKRYAVSVPPEKPNTPTKDMAKSTMTSIYVLWSEQPATAVPILGYKLYISAGTDEYELIYSNDQNPLIREFNVTGLVTGQIYQFKVAAINFNGDSPLSDALEKYSCLLPSVPVAPTRHTGTRTSLTLDW